MLMHRILTVTFVMLSWSTALAADYRALSASTVFLLEPREPKITLGDMRASGVRAVLIYCADHKCSHSIAKTALPMASAGRFSPLGPLGICPAPFDAVFDLINGGSHGLVSAAVNCITKYFGTV